MRAITRRSAWPAPPAMVPPYAPVWAPAPVVRPPAASGVAAAARACASAAVVGVPAQPAAQRSSTSCLRGLDDLDYTSNGNPNATQTLRLTNRLATIVRTPSLSPQSYAH